MQALFDLEATNTELKADLRDLYITSAKEVDVAGGRKAIIIHVSTLMTLTVIAPWCWPDSRRSFLPLTRCSSTF